MDLRMLEVYVPDDVAADVENKIDGCRHLGIWTVPLDGGRALVKALLRTRDSQSVLDRLDFHFLEPDAEAPVVVLSGRDESFCAGLDLATLGKGGVEAQELLVEMGELLLTIYGGRTRLVAACRGHAVAAGAMLLLVADHRVGAAGDYMIGFSELTRGMPLPELPVLLARERLTPRHLQASALLGRLTGPDVAREAGRLVGETVAGAFDDLYFLERACQLQVLAMSTGRPLKKLSENMAAHTSAGFKRNDGAPYGQVHFAALKRILDREEPGYAA